MDHLFTLTLVIYTLLFVFFRIPEIVLCGLTYTTQSLSIFIGTVVLHYHIPHRARYVLHIMTLVGIVYICDYYLLQPPPLVPPSTEDANEYYKKKNVVITGANAGIGYATSKRLAVEYGMNVIMGCRSLVKCNEAAHSINMELQSIQAASATATNGGGEGGGGSVTPMLLDLSNFDSIQLFVYNLLSAHYNIDILFNNAGYVPIVNDPINTKYNMESSYTSMHLGHFYLTELLVYHHPKLHVVNTSSGTHHLCGILSSKTNGCINNDFFTTGLYSPSDEYAYIRSKLANVLHVLELPKVHTQVSAIAIDLGWVGTSIQPWMKGELLPTPSSLGMMRSAYIGVTPILRALLLSSHDELSSSSIGRGGGVTMNVLGQLEESFSLPWWDKDAMIQLSTRLWDESVNILSLHGHDISDGVDVVMSDEGVSDKSIIVDDDKSTPPLVIINDEIPLIDAHTAGRMGDMDALTAIGAKDIEMLNVHDNNGWTPLHEAARFGHLEAVQFLINNGLDKVSTKPLSSVSW
jgi:NAD(P)-dependent dehydrogenase (short-subunit alcohol dehydrogenase family)